MEKLYQQFLRATSPNEQWQITYMMGIVIGYAMARATDGKVGVAALDLLMGTALTAISIASGRWAQRHTRK